MVLVSTVGAHPWAPMLFARSKGKLERALGTLGFETLEVLRPAFIRDSTIPRIAVEKVALNATVALAARFGVFARSRLAPTTCDAVAAEVWRRLP